jgi:aminoglycoside phosphotransferase (APT) family kinase protein
MPECASITGSFADAVSAIAAHYGMSREDVSVAPRQGQVNLTVYLGRELVLRIPRDRAVEDRLAKEAAVIPLVQGAGVPTSSLVKYDASLRIADVPYIVLERLHGQTLQEWGYEPESSLRANTSLSKILAQLHELRMTDIGSIHGVPAPHVFSTDQLVASLSEAGELGTAQARWLTEWFAFLETQGPVRSETVLLHGDVIPSNLMVDADGHVTAILDWGSADWGDAVRDFVDLPARALPSLLSAYRSATSSRSSDGAAWGDPGSLEAGALWYQLFWALAKLRVQPSTSESRNWAAPRQARFLEILRFLSTTPPSPWPDLVIRASQHWSSVDAART